jgi:hypothetical protein
VSLTNSCSKDIQQVLSLFKVDLASRLHGEEVSRIRRSVPSLNHQPVSAMSISMYKVYR